MNIDISQSESDEIFSDILFDYVEIRKPSVSTNPKGIILGGQPGSGKSYLKDEVMLEFNESFIFISTDDLRLYHPAYPELQQNPETVQNAANLVHPYASTWTKKLISHCIENKYNLIIDSTLGGDIDAVYGSIDTFRNNGYQVHLRVMAVPAIISKLSIFLRYETQLAEKGFARWTRMEDHDNRFDNLENYLIDIESKKRLDSIAFYLREYGKKGTKKISQFEYTDYKKAEEELNFLKYQNWRLFKHYREHLSTEEILFLITTSNKVLELIQKRSGDLETFENYIKEYLHFLDTTSFDNERKLLNPFILKILDNTKNTLNEEDDFAFKNG
jgi:predicted ABC-type ATPase